MSTSSIIFVNITYHATEFLWSRYDVLSFQRPHVLPINERYLHLPQWQHILMVLESNILSWNHVISELINYQLVTGYLQTGNKTNILKLFYSF